VAASGVKEQPSSWNSVELAIEIVGGGSGVTHRGREQQSGGRLLTQITAASGVKDGREGRQSVSRPDVQLVRGFAPATSSQLSFG